MRLVAATLRNWLLSLLGCAAAAAYSFVRLDTAIARHFWDVGRRLSGLGEGLGANILLSAESAVLLVIVAARLIRGRIPQLGEVTAIACLASMCAYVGNDHGLKVLFGVPNPADFMRGAGHGLHLMMGSSRSGFPSGHMALAGAFAGVFNRFYRRSIWPLGALLLLAAGLMLVGDWHFLSDIIAGTFVGLSAGALAGATWAAHRERR